ncbi:GNAT acetyltransferase [Haladaptatus litoreus]|uniref:GNAT acetyltransferase n=1 Tax=Haladaptatus litoreus TaxID=553468 RepID=A0A1N6XMS7_9EURY|nr:GNAT family N-acetyltransferase [Haladaptatus litoreus]SIR03633.1 GNAT acetyltransferase [Haladaptatus litoreus]
MTLAPRTDSALRKYWSDRLGVDEAAFDRGQATVGVAAEDGIQLFHCGDSLVVGAPESLAESVRQQATAVESLDCTDAESVREWFERFGSVTQVLGPTFYGYADSESFTPVSSNARLLTPVEESAYNRFRMAIPDEEWANGGTPFAPGETIGLFRGDALAAIAGYEVWDDFVAHIAVVTHPDHRGEGNGRAVVSRMTERALAGSLVPQYRTADEWPWSVALAERLGFERFATATLVCFE